MVSAATFRSLIHLQLIFVNTARKSQRSILWRSGLRIQHYHCRGSGRWVQLLAGELPRASGVALKKGRRNSQSLSLKKKKYAREFGSVFDIESVCRNDRCVPGTALQLSKER